MVAQLCDSVDAVSRLDPFAEASSLVPTLESVNSTATVHQNDKTQGDAIPNKDKPKFVILIAATNKYAFL